MKRLLFALLLFVASLGAQPLNTPVQVQPDCGPVFFDLTATSNSAQFDNRFLGCDSWTVWYNSTGFTAVSLIFQDAPDVSGVPGAWVTYAGTLVVGINPNTSIIQAETKFSGSYSWLRARLNAITGSGRVRGTFYGWRSGPTPFVIFPAIAAITANQGAAAGVAGRWPVYLSDGAAAQGVVGNPLYNRLSDGANAQGTQTNPLWERLSDGTNPFGTVANPLRTQLSTNCTLSAAIELAPATVGNQEIIAATPGQTIRVCGIQIANSAATDIKLVQGTLTKVACDTGPANLSGTYRNVLSAVLPYQSNPLTLTVSQALCLNASAGVNIGGLVLYDKF